MFVIYTIIYLTIPSMNDGKLTGYQLEALYSQPGFIRSILASLGELQNYQVWVEKSKRDNIPLYKLMHIVPVPFTG
jgi:hypothetical protein